MDLDAFVNEHGAEWNRLQLLAGRRRRKLSAAEVDELVMLYRRAATHLSVVRSRAADPTLEAWLSRVILQARAVVAPAAGFSWASVRRFFEVSFPLEVYRAGGWILGVAAAFLTAAVVVGYVVVRDPSIVASPEVREAYANSEFAAYYSANAPENFAISVWLNNTRVSALVLAAGVLFLPSLYVLWENASSVGAAGGVLISEGRGDLFFGLITVHGLLELTCVFVAAGAGLRIGWAWVAPGPLLTRVQSLAAAGRKAVVVALGLGVALLVSGLVEAFITPAPIPTAAKLVIGGSAWLVFILYVVIVGGAAARRQETADVAAFEREATAPTV